jgi:acetyl/propionyl-CoA carboxylase alpha subunit
MPAGPGVRVDTALEPGERVPAAYDNLIAKVMVHAADRPRAIDRLRRALDETEISGLQTTLPFHRRVARHPAFAAADLSTGWVAEHWDGPAELRVAARVAQLAAGLVTLDGDVVAAVPAPGVGVAGAVVDVDGTWRRDGRAAAMDRWPA